MSIWTGIIKYVSGKGWYFAENLADHSTVFVHQRQVENERYLKLGDCITFETAPSPNHKGKVHATNAKYVGHSISGEAVQS